MTVTGRVVRKGSLWKIQNGVATARFDFQFNPTDRTMFRTLVYTVRTPPGAFEPDAFFGNVGGTGFSLKLLLDATEEYDPVKQGTRAQKAWIEQFTHPDTDEYLEAIGSFTSPPNMLYSMGARSWYVRLMNVSFRDVRFNTDGYETRTWVDLDFQSVYRDLAVQQAMLQWIKRMAELVEVRVA